MAESSQRMRTDFKARNNTWPSQLLWQGAETQRGSRSDSALLVETFDDVPGTKERFSSLLAHVPESTALPREQAQASEPICARSAAVQTTAARAPGGTARSRVM